MVQPQQINFDIAGNKFSISTKQQEGISTVVYLIMMVVFTAIIYEQLPNATTPTQYRQIVESYIMGIRIILFAVIGIMGTLIFLECSNTKERINTIALLAVAFLIFEIVLQWIRGFLDLIDNPQKYSKFYHISGLIIVAPLYIFVIYTLVNDSPTNNKPQRVINYSIMNTIMGLIIIVVYFVVFENLSQQKNPDWSVYFVASACINVWYVVSNVIYIFINQDLPELNQSTTEYIVFGAIIQLIYVFMSLNFNNYYNAAHKEDISINSIVWPLFTGICLAILFITFKIISPTANDIPAINYPSDPPPPTPRPPETIISRPQLTFTTANTDDLPTLRYHNDNAIV